MTRASGTFAQPRSGESAQDARSSSGLVVKSRSVFYAKAGALLPSFSEIRPDRVRSEPSL